MEFRLWIGALLLLAVGLVALGVHAAVTGP